MAQRTAGKRESEEPESTVSTEEDAMIVSGAALFANKVYGTALPAGLRLTFSERRGETGPGAFRAAVLLSYPDALALRDMLNRMMDALQIDIVEPEETED